MSVCLFPDAAIIPYMAYVGIAAATSLLYQGSNIDCHCAWCMHELQASSALAHLKVHTSN